MNTLIKIAIALLTIYAIVSAISLISLERENYLLEQTQAQGWVKDRNGKWHLLMFLYTKDNKEAEVWVDAQRIGELKNNNN